MPAFTWFGRAGNHQDDYDRRAQRKRDEQVALHVLLHGLGLLVPRPGRSKPTLVGIRVRIRVRVGTVRVRVSVSIPRPGRSDPNPRCGQA